MQAETLQRITIDPEICHGKPTVIGLRYPVDMILELMASGMSVDELLTDYPDLQKAAILACLEYAIYTRNSRAYALNPFKRNKRKITPIIMLRFENYP